MKKNLFTSKKKYKFYLIIVVIILIILSIYLISFYIIVNQKYFNISNKVNDVFFIIPKDKEGEKVKFIDKKSVNNLTKLNDDLNNFNINELEYTIQLFSDINYENIENYIKNILDPKSEIISTNELFIFSINTEIGTDYFLTYKNFTSKIEAMSYCKKLSFVNKCLIVNPKN